MPRAAYLIPGRGGMWGGRCRDVRRRRFRFRRRFRRRFRFRRRRSPGWVAAVGRATHPRPTRDPPMGPIGPMGPWVPHKYIIRIYHMNMYHMNVTCRYIIPI